MGANNKHNKHNEPTLPTETVSLVEVGATTDTHAQLSPQGWVVAKVQGSRFLDAWGAANNVNRWTFVAKKSLELDKEEVLFLRKVLGEEGIDSLTWSHLVVDEVVSFGGEEVSSLQLAFVGFWFKHSSGALIR